LGKKDFNLSLLNQLIREINGVKKGAHIVPEFYQKAHLVCQIIVLR